MHPESLEKVTAFVSAYLAELAGTPLRILEVGSRTVLGQEAAYRAGVADPAWTYCGLDVEAGPNVDLVVTNPYVWTEVATGDVDVVLCASVLEHVPYFWMTVLEIARVLRPGGIAVIVAPSVGPPHRFPVDAWRFQVDGLPTLATYLDFEVLDAFVDTGRGLWADAILVVRKPIGDAAADARLRDRVTAQRRALDPDAPAAAPGPPSVRPSPLAAVSGGRLGPVLEARRAADLADRAAAARRERRCWRTRVRRALSALLARP